MSKEMEHTNIRIGTDFYFNLTDSRGRIVELQQTCAAVLVCQDMTCLITHPQPQPLLPSFGLVCVPPLKWWEFLTLVNNIYSCCVQLQERFMDSVFSSLSYLLTCTLLLPCSSLCRSWQFPCMLPHHMYVCWHQLLKVFSLLSHYFS